MRKKEIKNTPKSINERIVEFLRNVSIDIKVEDTYLILMEVEPFPIELQYVIMELENGLVPEIHDLGDRIGSALDIIKTIRDPKVAVTKHKKSMARVIRTINYYVEK